MNRELRAAWRLGAVFTIFLIASCASYTGASGSVDSHESRWQGRLALKIHTEPVQSFSAHFELQGDAQVGTLAFFTPIGGTAAHLQWDKQGAQLKTSGEPQQFATLDDLTRHATGATLPIASMFAWLQGQDPVTPGWQVDLKDLVRGRLAAHRLGPQIPAELKIILDQ